MIRWLERLRHRLPQGIAPQNAAPQNAAGLPDELLADLAADLAVLDELAPGLAPRTLVYVVDGDGEAVLGELAAHQDAGQRLRDVDTVVRADHDVVRAVATLETLVGNLDQEGPRCVSTPDSTSTTAGSICTSA